MAESRTINTLVPLPPVPDRNASIETLRQWAADFSRAVGKHLRDLKGKQLVEMSNVGDGQFLQRSGPTVIGAAGAGGTTVTVDGVALASGTADFDDATPPPAASAVNVRWQKDALTPTNISAFVKLVPIRTTEIDFGATPVGDTSFTIVDADVTANSHLLGWLAYEAPTGKDLDELEMDTIDLKFGPGVGQFTLFAKPLDGDVADKFKVNYLVYA